ncbi:hypothetical protein [Halorarum salinum]|uniref:Uncharacterized protein n=1 Tax=Halorarum salinum TaxID=2743089 RepID=A0A7D5QBK7_9EURY|nr:hypothetical protein [Halobaculum salinum]QLG63197.1 hypothetical protein HUG12_16240 [Halobaculum salinum]
MSTSGITRVDLDEPTDVWRFECLEGHSSWRLAGDVIYCRTCREQRLGAGHTYLWDKREEQDIAVDEIEFVADRSEWRR